MAKEVNEKLLLRGELAELEEREPKLRGEFKERANRLANITLSFVRLPVEECDITSAKKLLDEMDQLQKEIKQANDRMAEIRKRLEG